MKRLSAILCCAALGLGACGKSASKDETGESGGPQAAAAEQAAVPSGPVAPPEPTAEEIPVAEDFEEEATAQVTAENYKAELDSIAKELDAEE